MLTSTLSLYRNAFAGLSNDIWRLALVTLINRSGTMVVPFLTVYMTIHLGYTLPQAGFVMSCFGVGSILGTYLGGQLTDRTSYYKIMFWSLFLSGILFILLGQVRELATMCLAVFILSTVADSFRPANFAAVATYARPENVTRSFSLIRLAINLGFAIGPAIGGILAHWFGYNWLFWADGLTCIGAAFFFRLTLTEKREPSHDAVEQPTGPIKQSAYRDRQYLTFIFFITLTAIAFMQFFSVIPVYFKEQFGFNEDQIGYLLALNGLLIALVEMPLVYRLDGRVNRLLLVSGGAAFIGLSYLLYWAFDFWSGIAVIAIIVITIGEMFNMPFANAYALARSNPRNRGQYMALYGIAYSIAHVVSPTVGMQVAGRLGYHALWMVLGGLCLVAIFGFLSLKRRQQLALS
ncbi:MAG: MFS transporter [Lewinellaceae bacterium]|nr:MFS transporter [Lewinellaceae bacterium]